MKKDLNWSNLNTIKEQNTVVQLCQGTIQTIQGLCVSEHKTQERKMSLFRNSKVSLPTERPKLHARKHKTGKDFSQVRQTCDSPPHKVIKHQTKTGLILLKLPNTPSSNRPAKSENPNMDKIKDEVF